MTKFWVRRFLQQLIIRLTNPWQIRDKHKVRSNYSMVGTRDLELYFNSDAKRKCIVNNKLKETTSKEIRDFHLSFIEKFIVENKVQSVLELGSGTSINLYILKEKFPHISIQGIDLVEARIATGNEYFKSRNFFPNAMVADATDLPFKNNTFDLVYSVHCFEQMNQYIDQAIKEAIRVARIGVLFLEPDWKYSNWPQKLFLRNNDYLCRFDEKIREHHQDFIHNPLYTYFNPLNRTGLFIIKLKP